MIVPRLHKSALASYALDIITSGACENGYKEMKLLHPEQRLHLEES